MLIHTLAPDNILAFHTASDIQLLHIKVDRPHLKAYIEADHTPFRMLDMIRIQIDPVDISHDNWVDCSRRLKKNLYIQFDTLVLDKCVDKQRGKMDHRMPIDIQDEPIKIMRRRNRRRTFFLTYFIKCLNTKKIPNPMPIRDSIMIGPKKIMKKNQKIILSKQKQIPFVFV
jgi:hypothetical protein